MIPFARVLRALVTNALLAIAILSLVIAAGGHEVAPALRALWDGSFGSSYALASATLVPVTFSICDCVCVNGPVPAARSTVTPVATSA